MRRFDRFPRSPLVFLLFATCVLLPALVVPNPVSAQPFVTFGSFQFTEQRVEDRKDAFEDRLDLRGTFTLGGGSNGIDPVQEAVEVRIEGVGGRPVFTQTIPPGAFQREDARPGRQRFEFEADGEGQLEEIRLRERGAGRFAFRIRGEALQFSAASPRTIIFVIGDDGGATDVAQGEFQRELQELAEEIAEETGEIVDETNEELDKLREEINEALEEIAEEELEEFGELEEEIREELEELGEEFGVPRGPLERQLIGKTQGLAVAASLEAELVAVIARLEQTKGLTTDGRLISLLTQDQEAKRQIGRFFDLTPPEITASFTPEPNENGWNNSDVTVRFAAADTLSGIAEVTAPITLTAEGANQVVTGTATDVAGNSATASVTINLDKTPPTISPTISPAPNANGWNNTDVTVSFIAQDGLSGIASVTPPVALTTEGSNQGVSGSATDRAGNIAFTGATVNLDKTPPNVSITSPTNGAILLNASSVPVTGTLTEALSGVASVTCNGNPATLSESTLTCNVPLTEGANSILVQATDVAGNTGSSSVAVTVVRAPVVRITAPANLNLFNVSPITVTGTVDDLNATVVVDGISASISAGTFTAAGVPLREGANLITATATNTAGNAGTGSITVVLDTTPPTVRIDFPADGAILTQSRVTVTGRISDVGVSAGPGQEAKVTVNGVPVAVSNDTFLVPDLPLKRGPNTIIATAEDRAGNASVQTIIVTRQELAGQRINLVSGNNQTGVIGATLTNPLVVTLTDANGNSVAGRPVTFAVSRGDGVLGAGTRQGRRLTVVTDALGQAVVSFTVGTRSGVGNQRVTATAAGFVGEVLFSATANHGAATQLKTVSGENQRGVPAEPLAKPFVVFVHDQAGNPVAGVPVVFTVTAGGGNILGATSFTDTTDADGRASVVLTLGPAPGRSTNIVEASFVGMTGLPATFTASGVPAQPGETTVSGVVFDNSNLPIAGVTASIEGTTLQAVTDAQGQFTISNVPVGTRLLRVDGSTTTRPGVWPALEFEITTIPGQDNTIGMPIFLLPLDAPNAKIVGGAQDVTLTMKDVPGFSLTVFANSATFPDGSTVGQVMVTQVHSDKVPMPPIEGAAPRLVWTVQPEGVLFNPPARVTYPNIDNLKSGQVVDIFSFDHDLGQFVSVGTGTVSEDGSVITSDPGVGIRKAGWGYPEPPPEPITVAEGPADEVTDLPAPAAGPGDAAFNTSLKDSRGIRFPGQDDFNATIRKAFETIPNSGLTVVEFKALIATESSFDPLRGSPTGALGLLQFTSVGIKDINKSPGALGRDFNFNDPTDTEQAIPAGLRALELARDRLTTFFSRRGGIPADFKTMQIAVYNGGIGTVTKALEFANATSTTSFNDLVTPPLGGAVADTPLFKAVQALPVGNGLGKNPTLAAIEKRFNEIRNYPGKVLDTAATNTQ